MYLLIDTNESRFSLFEPKDSLTDLPWVNVQRDKSLTREIRGQKKHFKGSVVLQGKGVFSQTREGVVFANIFRQAKQVPILSVTEEELSSKNAESLEGELLGSTQQVLLPHYFAEPNIT